MMGPKNQTLATEFILLGFSKDLRTNIVIFLLFLVMYLLTCVGNSLIVFIIILSPHLHTPMYFFLCSLSFLDLFYSSNAVPQLLINIFSAPRVVSIGTCGFQLYCSLFLGGTECLLLVLMAYDRYVAICRPLYYSVIMSWTFCYQLTAIIWIGSFVFSVLPSLVMPIKLCNPNLINHFMCDTLAILKLACDNMVLGELVMFTISVILLIVPFIIILVSYIYIITSILHLDSVGRSKAFSTCSSHLTVVSLYYGTAILMYSGSFSKDLSNQEKYVSVVYVILTPMLNPLIYSLKNREIKEAFSNLEAKTFAHCQ